MFEHKVVTPPTPRRISFHLMGMGVLAINKLRYAVKGYREPRPFATSEFQKAITYDRQVVTNWLDALHEYGNRTVKEKTVLELGPGADLGPALFLLDHGAKQYITVDANRLIDETPYGLYSELLASLDDGKNIKSELDKTLAGNDERIQYLVDPKFDLSNLEKDSVDLVVSQAAFEHFSDIKQTVSDLTPIVKQGGVLIAEVDLMTHTGVVRSRDPLNIFRYSNFFYRLMNFSGIPNRVRPNEYKTIFEQHGWKDVEIIPLQELPREYVETIHTQLARPFRNDETDMHVLTFLIRATKA